jgi:hypothetical protein
MYCQALKDLQRNEAEAMDNLRLTCSSFKKAQYTEDYLRAQWMVEFHEESCEICKPKRKAA